MIRLQFALGAASVAFATVAAVATGFVADNSRCCETYDTKCENAEGTTWTCEQTSSAAGFDVIVARHRENGDRQGMTDIKTGAARGSCQYTYRTCGGLPGECIPGAAPVTVQCNDTALTGATCPSTP
jgi:hypothetical protein